MKGSENQGPEKSAKETERHHRLSEQAQQLILDDLFIEAVEKARVDKEERTRMTKDPEAYLRERGVEIPEEIHLEMTAVTIRREYVSRLTVLDLPMPNPFCPLASRCKA